MDLHNSPRQLCGFSRGTLDLGRGSEINLGKGSSLTMATSKKRLGKAPGVLSGIYSNANSFVLHGEIWVGLRWWLFGIGSITKASSGRAKLEFLFTKIGVGSKLIWPRDRIDISKERALHPPPPPEKSDRINNDPPPPWD